MFDIQLYLVPNKRDATMLDIIDSNDLVWGQLHSDVLTREAYEEIKNGTLFPITGDGQ